MVKLLQPKSNLTQCLYINTKESTNMYLTYIKFTNIKYTSNYIKQYISAFLCVSLSSFLSLILSLSYFHHTHLIRNMSQD